MVYLLLEPAGAKQGQRVSIGRSHRGVGPGFPVYGVLIRGDEAVVIVVIESASLLDDGRFGGRRCDLGNGRF